MLDTNLNHIDSMEKYENLANEGQTAAVVCGRMGPMCIPVYDLMEDLENKYSNVKFYDMFFDSSVAMKTIRSLPETRSFNGLPFTVYYKNGKVVAATSSIQNKHQVKAILDAKLV